MDNDRILINGLIHGGSDGTDQIGLFAECRAVGQYSHPGMLPPEEPQAYPVAFKNGGQFRHKPHGRFLKAFVLHSACKRIQDMLKALTQLCGLKGLAPPQHDLEPRRTPMEQSQDSLHLLLWAPGNLKDNDSMKFSGDFYGIGDVIALGLGILGTSGGISLKEQTPTLFQSPLNSAGQVGHVVLGIGPEGNGREGALVRGAQEHHGAFHPCQKMALNGQPALAESLWGGGLGKPLPQLTFRSRTLAVRQFFRCMLMWCIVSTAWGNSFHIPA